MSTPRELLHEKGYVSTGSRVVDNFVDKVFIRTGHVEGIRAVQDDASVEWWYRHEYVGQLVKFGFDQGSAVALANKALSEHYLAAIHQATGGRTLSDLERDTR